MMVVIDKKICEIVPKIISVYISEFAIIEAKKNIFRFFK